MKMLRVIPFLLVGVVAALCQIPGQSPGGQYPGGQYPGGQYPGQTRIPNIPGTNNPNGRPRTGQPKQQPDSRGGRSSSSNASLLTTTTGILRRATSNQLVIQSDDHRVIWYRLASQMTIQKEIKDASLSEFALGDYLSVDSNSDDEGIMTAVSVTWKKAGTPEDRDEASKTWDLPRIETAAARSSAKSTSSASSPPREAGDERPVLRRKDSPAEPPAKAEEPKKTDEPKEVAKAAPSAPKEEEPEIVVPATVMKPPDPRLDADDPGKPALRRGVPAPRPQTQTASATSVAPTLPPVPTNAPAKAPVVEVAPQPIPIQDDPVITKAREAAASYLESLPNYLVQQMTTRYQSDRPKSGWTALDIVTADVTVQDGLESYKNIKVGNKSVNTPMDQIEGTRSTGEFSTMLEQLLENGAAKFRAGGTDTIHNRSAYKYSFEIPRELSRWRIESPSQLYYPATKGTIWIDKETSRVLRIEQQGKPMPALFPFDTIESATDWDFIRLGTSGPYLLPVEAEVLSCQRGTSICSRNKIEFRNYRKFGAETNITFDQPQ
jgi:hypothetical protein